jgi:hypothetical protein
MHTWIEQKPVLFMHCYRDMREVTWNRIDIASNFPYWNNAVIPPGQEVGFISVQASVVNIMIYVQSLERNTDSLMLYWYVGQCIWKLTVGSMVDIYKNLYYSCKHILKSINFYSLYIKSLNSSQFPLQKYAEKNVTSFIIWTPLKLLLVSWNMGECDDGARTTIGCSSTQHCSRQIRKQKTTSNV